jgi:5-carboxymethyl-2-hydroxymuconate isomerase
MPNLSRCFIGVSLFVGFSLNVEEHVHWNVLFTAVYEVNTAREKWGLGHVQRRRDNLSAYYAKFADTPR